LDLSEGGLRFTAKAGLERDDEVEVLLHGFRQVKRFATVRWVRSLDNNRCLIGLRFQSRLTFAELQALVRP
jgi:hypothetical protein